MALMPAGQRMNTDIPLLQFINDVEGQLNNGNNSGDNGAAATEVQVRSWLQGEKQKPCCWAWLDPQVCLFLARH